MSASSVVWLCRLHNRFSVDVGLWAAFGGQETAESLMTYQAALADTRIACYRDGHMTGSSLAHPEGACYPRNLLECQPACSASLTCTPTFVSSLVH